MHCQQTHAAPSHKLQRRALTCIADSKASKLASAPIGVLAALYERQQKAMLVQGTVEVCRVPAHVPQQVADTSSHSRLSMRKQLTQLDIGLSLCQRRVVVPVQPCQLADGQQSSYQDCWWVTFHKEPA